MKVLGSKQDNSRSPLESLRRAEELSLEARKLAGPGLPRGLYKIRSYAELDALRTLRIANRNARR